MHLLTLQRLVHLSRSSSPWFFLAGTAFSIFTAEVLVMFLFLIVPKLPELFEPFVDGGLLSILVSPALYYFLYQPLRMENRERQLVEQELRRSGKQLQLQTEQLMQTLQNLQDFQLKLVQSEKMSALGNLVAGVAHEINNPLGFIAGNLAPAEDYVRDLLRLIDLYQQKFPRTDAEISDELEAIDFDYIREDLPKLLNSMKEGVVRIHDISTSLRTFSRADHDHPVFFNIHDGINSTILILKHRLKANESRQEIKITTSYSEMPPIECFPGQLNQVFMNLLANAIDALEEANRGRTFKQIEENPNRIGIYTALIEDGQRIQIRIQDNGVGISDQVKQKVFDHVFTTKEIGKGTGLGLAISRQIVVEKHRGSIQVNSELGQGSEFIVTLPIHKTVVA